MFITFLTDSMGRGSVLKTLVVAISGVTCSGKSTLAKRLGSDFDGATVICQDDFFYKPGDPRLPRPMGIGDTCNWDCLESIDMVSMMRAVRSTLDDMNRREGGLLFIEGFLVLNYVPLAELCHLKYFLTLPRDVCESRRKLRTDYEPPDPVYYFEQYAWPMYQKHLKELQSSSYASDIRYLDGTLPMDINVASVSADIRKACNAFKINGVSFYEINK